MTEPATIAVPVLIKVSKIVVRCELNEPMAVRAGGPEFLGFEFVVPEVATASIIHFIRRWLHKCKRPLLDIVVTPTDSRPATDQFCTRKQIEEAIKNGY